MTSLTQNDRSPGRGDFATFLNEVQEIRAGIDEIDQKVDELELLQRQTLVNPNSSTSGSANEELDNLGSGIKALCHSLTDRVYKVKNSPAGHQLNSAQQIGSILNRIRGVISRFEQVKATHRQKLQAQIARQYRVVRPDASEEEVQAAVEGSIDPQQIFQRAILGSIRHGEAQAALESVKDRHAQVQKIEEEMTEIAELFENLNTLVVQQERPIAQSQQMNEEAVKNLDLGSQEMDVAVGNARKMRKKKWLCLGMAVTIIVVAIIIIIAYFMITKSNNVKRYIQEPPLFDENWLDSTQG